MSYRILKSTIRILLAFILIAAIMPAAAAQSDPVPDLLNRINTLRVQNGLLPLGLSSILNTAAQRHCDDMAATGNIDHAGSDGSAPLDRIRAAGYGHWSTYSWHGENIYGGQSATVSIAWNFWINSAPHLQNLLNVHYREVGIGVGHGSNGGTYFTLDFGAQPDVIPFFITRSDLGTVDSAQITLILGNEEDTPAGEGSSIMGRATEVRIVDGSDISSAAWQPWAASINFQLSDTPGPHTISVEYRDDQQRTATYVRTVTLSSSATAGQSLAPVATLASTATPTAPATPAPTSTAIPTDTPTPQPTETLAPTNTPEPTATSTNAPTSTPRPSPTSTLTPSITPTSPAGSRLTPPAPLPTPTQRPLLDGLSGMPSGLLTLVGGLQVLVVILGLIAIGKRLMK